MSVKPVRQYPYWLVTTEYGDDEDHWQSQNRQWLRAWDLGKMSVDWDHGQTTPAHWNGYGPNNPSPGRNINRHFWRVYDEQQAMLFYMAEGTHIQKIEEKQS
jgi:hypothetical protein